MNYGGDAADQIVRYSMEGMEHTLRISGSIAKNLAVFIVAVLKDQKKTYGKTQMVRMIKERRPTKFFTVPDDRMKEFAREAKARGLLYVVIKDKKKPINNEIMVFAEDAAKMNRVLDRMDIDYVKAESGKVEFDTSDPKKEETKGMELERTTKEGHQSKVRRKKFRPYPCQRELLNLKLMNRIRSLISGICSLKKEILRRGRKKSFRPGLPRPAEIFLPVRKIGNMEQSPLCVQRSKR